MSQSIMLRLLCLSLCVILSFAQSTKPPYLASLEFAPSDVLSLTPSFTPSIFSYQIFLNESISKAFVKPMTNESNTFVQVRVNDGPFIHGDNDALSVSLIDGINHLLIQTGDEDTRVSVATYVITICNGANLCALNRRPQEGAQLQHLSIKQIELYPAFKPSHYFYTARCSRHVHAARIAATMRLPKDGLIAASMNGEVFDALSNGQFSEAMPMKVGRNYLFVQARDAHDSLVTYTLLIDRGVNDAEKHERTSEQRESDIDMIGGLATISSNNPSTLLTSLVSSIGLFSPRFSSNVFAYAQSVDYHTSSLKLTATPIDRHARMHITYYYPDRPLPRAAVLERATQSQAIPLEPGTNIITIWVTGSNYDSEPQAYELNVTRLSEGEAASSNQHIHHKARLAHHSADPQLTSIRGARYSVHVEEGEVYNLLSEPHLLVNARWSNLCSTDADCVLGISEIGIRTRSGHTVHLISGAGMKFRNAGLARVTLNNSPLNTEDQAIIDNSDEEFHEEEEVNESYTPSQSESINQSTAELFPIEAHRMNHVHTELLTYNRSNIVSFITATWHLSFVDSEKGIDARVDLIGPLTVGAHGLIGQTYRAKRIGQMHQHGDTDQAIDRQEGSEDSMSLIEGDMLDFRIQDGDLFATKFEFNLYEQE